MVLRITGMLVLVLAAATLVIDLAASPALDAVRLTALGELWYRLHPGSLELTQAVVERYLWPPLWNPGIVTVLLWPVAAVFGAVGLVLLGIGFAARRKR